MSRFRLVVCRSITALVILVSVAFLPPATAADAGDRVYWKNGLRFEAADGSTKIKLGGRIHNDFAWISVDDMFREAVGELDDGTEMRRARLALSGTVYHSVEFKAQYDFVKGVAGFRDMYMGVNGLGVLDYVRVGQQKEPVGLEFMTSSNYITFMERGSSIIFNPDRNVGIRTEGASNNEAVNGSVGVFRRTNEQGLSSEGDALDVTGRISGSPWYAEDGRKVFHLGVAGVFTTPPDDTLRYRARPEIHTIPRQIDTAELPAKSATLVNAEAAVVLGPVSAQGEFAWNKISSMELEDPAFTAWYAFVSWFVTGESRPYYRKGGSFTRVKPKRMFHTKGGGGAGAWEVAARISGVDLDQGTVEGGRMTTVTVGVNWYLNPATRVMANYVRADVKDTGVVNSLQTRFQIDF